MSQIKPLLMAVTAIIACAPYSQAFSSPINFEFTKVADTNTLMPGGIGTFERFDLASDVSAFGAGPSVHSGQVAFNGGTGANPTVQRGIYTWNSGTLSLIADRNTIIPGAPANRTFANFSNPVIENGQVAFTGNNSGGVYRTNGSTLIRIADSSQTIPGTTIGFDGFYGPAFSNGELAFRGGPGAAGNFIFKTENGQLVKIVDTDTTVPGTTSTFVGVTDNADIENGQVVFSGTTGGSAPVGGIYMGNGGNLTTIVDSNTLIPDGRVPGATFTPNFQSPAIDGGQVAFFSSSSSIDNGIYFFDGQSLKLIADTRTLLPDPLGSVTDFRNTFEAPAIDSGVVTFAAGTAASGASGPGHPQGGIYSTFGGELGKVIDIDDVLDGKDLVGVFVGQHGLDADSLAFYAQFADGSEGIYLAKANLTAVPLPAAAWLMLSGVMSLLLAGKRKKSLLP